MRTRLLISCGLLAAAAALFADTTSVADSTQGDTVCTERITRKVHAQMTETKTILESIKASLVARLEAKMATPDSTTTAQDTVTIATGSADDARADSTRD